MVAISQDPNARFEKAIFNLLRSFNYIDINVGLLISFISEKKSTQEIYKKLSKKTFEQKLRWFKSLLSDSNVHQYLDDKGISEFEDWLSRAHSARQLRNRYVHAIWRFLPLSHATPVNISNPIWMKDLLGNRKEAMSLDELEEKAIMVENVFKDFMRLRKNYRI